MQRVLIIRQEEEAIPLTNILRENGVLSYVSPLFTPRFFPLPPLGNAQGLIITSKNALRAIKDQEALKNLPLYAVGDKTAELAAHFGFKKIFSASGDNKALCALIQQKAFRSKEILWYLSGKIIKGDSIGQLTQKGFAVRRQVVYDLQAERSLPPSLEHTLTQREISHILFFSPHTTEIFLTLLTEARLEAIACEMTALCISPDVVKKAVRLPWKKVWVSPKPTTEAMIGYFRAKI